MHRTIPCRRSQTGAVAIIVGICIAVLVGFAGLALDLGRLYVNKTELQNAADACALAASRELTCSTAPCPTSNLSNARAAGVFVAGRAQRDLQSSPVVIAPEDVKFSTLLAPNDLYKSIEEGADTTSKYVMCIARSTGIVPWFMGVLGIGAQDVNARAVATLAAAQTNCAIPMALCSKGAANAKPPYGLYIGQWYGGRFGAGGGATGNFNWVDFTPPAGGADEVTDLLKGNGLCSMNVKTPVGEGGVLGNTGARAFNSRFGIYHSGIGTPKPAPDYTGYAYTRADMVSGATFSWPDGANALSDFLTKRDSHVPYGTSIEAGNGISGLNINKNSNSVETALEDKGADRRLVISPIVNCSGWGGGSTTTPILAWACVLLLHPIDGPGDDVYFEYRGLSSDPASPCATSGSVGGPGSVGPQVPALVQ